MSDVSQGPGWWQASDGRWYPPTAHPGTPTLPPAPGPPAWAPPPGYGYPYAPNPYGTATGLPSVSGLATASLILGIVGAIPCCGFTHLAALAALPLGITALTRINKGTADPNGKGQAIAGVVLGSVGIVLGILTIVLLIASSNDPYAMGVTGPVQ